MVANRSMRYMEPLGNLFCRCRLVLNKFENARPDRIADGFELLNCTYNQGWRKSGHFYRNAYRQDLTRVCLILRLLHVYLSPILSMYRKYGTYCKYRTIII